VSALARDIERACKQGVIEDAIQGFARLRDMAADTLTALTRLRDAMAAE
jgi:hypothetical protein